MACRKRTMLAALVALTTGAMVPVHAQAQSKERALTIFNIHTKETVTAVFKRNGRFIEEGVEKLDQIMRDHRRNEATKMDRELFDLLWEIHTELGSKAPIHLISGYRSSSTNALLRRTVGGQAKQSRHMLGKAADVHFPDVPVKQLRYSALIQQRGGVGYYPTSAIPFVHLDTDRVRSWPRLPRHELALLFPSGSTQHAPADGGPITRDDVRLAKAGHGELAQQIASFLGHRRDGKAPIALADAGIRAASTQQPARRVAMLPRHAEREGESLDERPQLADAPTQVSLRASLAPSFGGHERIAQVMKLAAAIPRLVSGPVPAHRPEAAHLASLTTDISLPAPPADTHIRRADQEPRILAALEPAPMPRASLTDVGRFDWAGWIAAPAYDEEHPEEMSYRPFPIAPYLTESAEQIVMGELVTHDATRTLDALDQIEASSTFSFRLTGSGSKIMAAQRFTGTAVKLDAMNHADPSPHDTFETATITASQR